MNSRPHPAPSRWTLSILMVCLLLSNAIASEGRSFDFSKGQTWSLWLRTQQATQQALFGSNQDTTHTMELRFAFEVTAVDQDGSATLEGLVERVAVNQVLPLTTVSYDSASPTTFLHPLVAGYPKMLGAHLRMSVLPTGEVPDVRGMNAVIDDMMKAFRIGSPATNQAYRQQIQEQLGDEALKEKLTLALRVFPDRPAAASVGWSRESTQAIGIPIARADSWHDEGSTTEGRTFRCESSLKSDPATSTKKVTTVTMKYELGGTAKRRVLLDPERGWILASAMLEVLSGKVDADGIPDYPKGYTWPLEMTTLTQVQFLPRAGDGESLPSIDPKEFQP